LLLERGRNLHSDRMKSPKGGVAVIIERGGEGRDLRLAVKERVPNSDMRGQENRRYLFTKKKKGGGESSLRPKKGVNGQTVKKEFIRGLWAMKEEKGGGKKTRGGETAFRKYRAEVSPGRQQRSPALFSQKEKRGRKISRITPKNNPVI